MTKEQAIELAESGFWKTMSHQERAMFQLYEDRLCMPFEVFHEAVEKVLDRSVFTHEFAHQDGLRAELLGDKPKPSLADIINLIPKDKQVIIAMKETP